MTEVLIERRRIPEERIPGKPLGRHIHTDSRSARYPFRPATVRDLTSVLWHRDIAVLDQGNLGSCTGNALVGAVGTDPIYPTLPSNHVALDEALAVKVYSLATSLDSYPGQYPPNDTGSDGLDACKAAVQLGLISGYTHATDVTSMQQALMQQPVIIGINWYSSFDNPSSNGTVSISSNAYVRGGHEVEVLGMDPGTGMFLAENSWGPDWGFNGTFQFSFDTMTRLLAEGGDCTVPQALNNPPTPTPTPTPEPAALDRERALESVAGPWAAKARFRSDLVDLKAAIQAWEKRAGF